MIPLLVLFEPGSFTNVGVSKPAGASVGGGNEFWANSGPCRPTAQIIETIGARMMRGSSLKLTTMSSRCESGGAALIRQRLAACAFYSRNAHNFYARRLLDFLFFRVKCGRSRLTMNRSTHHPACA